MSTIQRLAALSMSLVLFSVCIAADDVNVQQDPKADLATFKTFALRNGTIKSARPELDNPLVVKKLRTTIRDALTGRGLKEATGAGDLFVDFVVTGEDFSTTEPPLARGAGPRSVRFTESTLVIDLTRPGGSNPAWRGVYKDDEKTGSKLVYKLPDDAKKLIERYPRQTR